jgi:Catalase
MKPQVALELGKEYPGPDEDKIANKLIDLLQDQMRRMYPPGKTQLRQVHAKMNGCAKAEFTVNADIRPELKVGIFKEAKSYPAWIRFSNGETHIIPDKKKDFRGFAIKVMNVPGKKMDPNHPDVPYHDFVLMNRKIFFSKNIYQFEKIIRALTARRTLSSVLFKAGVIVTNLPTIINAVKGKIVITNPAERSYFSTTPYRFGDKSKAVKYAVIPREENTAKLINPDTTSDDYLRVNLAATLLKNELVYDFCIQFQEDAEKMPIEDPSVEWTSPYEKVATIRIPRQNIDTPDRLELGEIMPFNTWHCLSEHQPLGSFNRVRKVIYDAMYDFRHNHNGIQTPVFEAGPDFFNDTNK